MFCLNGKSRTHLSVASWESSQSHPRHVKQPDLPIVVRKSDDFLVHRHADPERSKQGTQGQALSAVYGPSDLIRAKSHSYLKEQGRVCL